MKIWLKIILGFVLTTVGMGIAYATGLAIKRENRRLNILSNKKGGDVPDGGDQPLPSGTQGVFFGKERGLRNNNPGNIEKIPNDTWQGQIGSDGRFVIFTDLEHGARALLRVLRTYHTKHKIYTISDIINRWAPEWVINEKGEKVRENDTAKYIEFVSQKTGISPDTKLTLNAQDTYCRIAQAMCHFETGSTLPMNIFHAGWQMV